MSDNLIPEQIFIFGVISLAIYKAYLNIKQEIILSKILISLAIVLIPLWIFLIYKTYKKVKKRNKETKERNESIKKDNELMEDFLHRDLNNMTSEQLKKLLKKVEIMSFFSEIGKQFKKLTKERIKIANLILHKKDLNEEISTKIKEKNNLNYAIQELEIIKQKKEQELRTKKEDILEHLDIDENNVFLMEDLTKKEIEALKEEGFKKINEYDPILQENSNFLVKQVLNHHLTHTLLVERTKKMLLQYLEYNEVKIHDTRDADITFKVGNKKYAFEIETGNLLGKKVQLREKVEELNRRYKKNWYFIVSNQNLLTKYRKYGKSTPRSGVRRIVEKIVDI
ncbi:MAG: hypothetical protein ACTSWK_16845 [Promethearchaeota archaeon]